MKHFISLLRLLYKLHKEHMTKEKNDEIVNTPKVEEDEYAELFKASKKKKTRKLKIPQPSAEEDDGIKFPEPYDYNVLLERIYSNIRKKNPNLQENKRYIIKPPVLSRVGTRRMAWSNFHMLCNTMHRPAEHIFQFVLSELGTEGSISGDGQLILRGRYNAANIETLLRKYIVEYVTCRMCRSPDTVLDRDQQTRLYTMQCKVCGANRSVNTIRSGFHAISRADRRKAKAAL